MQQMNRDQKNVMSREHFVRTAALLAAGFLLPTRKLFAQTSPVILIKQAAAKDPVLVKPLRSNIHLLQGSGGNIAVFHGAEGKLMVDAGIAVSQAKIIKALNGISPAPLRFLINTHWHFDHAEGNEWVHKAGAEIIAHENTRKNLAKTITVKDWNYTFPAAASGALPKRVFKNDDKLTFNGKAVEMKFHPAAHTDSDITVYFPHADILHVGDTWWNNHYPFIDHSTGGTLAGMIAAADRHLNHCSDKTIIVPGHGAVGTKAELRTFRDMLVTVKQNVSKLKKEGLSLAETIASKPTARFDKKFGKFAIDAAFFTRLVYADV
jgi:glyoxylase-like metal-dependent hydrolase (beta-lactamase superfamily II)